MEQTKDKQGNSEVRFSERVELAGRVAAVLLPLTYVSGYLISTSYLGTYGLHLSSGDLFRAKYIYIGFEYLMFIVMVIAVFRILMRVGEVAVMALRTPTPEGGRGFERDLERACEVFERRESSLGQQSRRKFQDLRGDLVVGLMVLVFTVEIMFLNPENVVGILPRQILFLLGLAIYQATFYRESYEPFAWGFVDGRRQLEDVRWALLLAQTAAAASLLAKVALNMMRDAHLPRVAVMLILGCEIALTFFAIEVEVMGAVFVCTRRKRLIEIDKDPFFDPQLWEAATNVGLEIWNSFRERRAIKGTIKGYFFPCGHPRKVLFFMWRLAYLIVPAGSAFWFWRTGFLKRPSLWTNLILVGAPLPLSLLVLSNVGVLTLLMQRRSQRLRRFRMQQESRIRLESTLANLRIEQVELTSIRGDRSDEVTESVLTKHDRERDSVEPEPWERIWKLTRRGILAAVLYVTSVLSFGYVVYPHIPVQKAGGNYVTVTAPVCVRMIKEAPQWECPGDLLPALKQGEAFIPLEEDSDWVYLARNNDADGPRCWTWAGLKPVYCRPRVYAISRRCIAGTVDANAEGCTAEHGSPPTTPSIQPPVLLVAVQPTGARASKSPAH